MSAGINVRSLVGIANAAKVSDQYRTMLLFVALVIAGGFALSLRGLLLLKDLFKGAALEQNNERHQIFQITVTQDQIEECKNFLSLDNLLKSKNTANVDGVMVNQEKLGTDEIKNLSVAKSQMRIDNAWDPNQLNELYNMKYTSIKDVYSTMVNKLSIDTSIFDKSQLIGIEELQTDGNLNTNFVEQKTDVPSSSNQELNTEIDGYASGGNEPGEKLLSIYRGSRSFLPSANETSQKLDMENALQLVYKGLTISLIASIFLQIWLLITFVFPAVKEKYNDRLENYPRLNKLISYYTYLNIKVLRRFRIVLICMSVIANISIMFILYSINTLFNNM